jgi:hypothetical protein
MSAVSAAANRLSSCCGSREPATSPLREARGVADIPAGRAVVYEGKISWPARGPNVDWTIGSTMRRRAN